MQACEQERPWTDLKPYIKTLTTFFDHHGPAMGTNDDTLRSYDQSDVKSKNLTKVVMFTNAHRFKLHLTFIHKCGQSHK